MAEVRDAALDVLDQFHRTGMKLSDILEEILTKTKFPVRDRSRIMVLTRDVLRWQGRLDLWIHSGLHRKNKRMSPSLRHLLRMAVYELLMDPSTPDYAVIDTAVRLSRERVGDHASGFVNAILRKLKKTERDIPPFPLDSIASRSSWFSVPPWLLSKWETHLGMEQAQKLCRYINKVPRLTIRRNDLKISSSEFVNSVGSNTIQLEPVPGSDRFYDVLRGGAELQNSSWFKQGTFAFQDRASGAVVELLDPQREELILDVCAAPGTKTVYIAERIGDKGTLLASDANPERVHQGVKDMGRHGMTSITWEVKDAARDPFPDAHRILVDVPCSGTGVIRRRPDIKWRRQPEQIEEMVSIQLEILKHMSQFLKRGGILVYATCSLEPEENWNVVDTFLKLNPHFIKQSARSFVPREWVDDGGALVTFPPRDHVDGMFAVRMKLQ